MEEKKQKEDDEVNEVLESEIDFCLAKINKCVDNESSWNYLRTIVNHLIVKYSVQAAERKVRQEAAQRDKMPLAKVLEFCNEKYRSSSEDDSSPFLLAFLVDMNETQVNELLSYSGQLPESAPEEKDKAISEVKKIVKNSTEIIEALATKYDVIRANYWRYQMSIWKDQYANFILLD